MVSSGGVNYDINNKTADLLTQKLLELKKDVEVAVTLLWNTPSVLSRFEFTGTITKEIAKELGLVGVPARASGIQTDCRFNFPSGIYSYSQIPVSTWNTGDVFARAYVRWLEIQK